MRSDLDISEIKRRKRERIIIICALVVVLLLGVAEYVLMADRTGLPPWGNLLIFAIINLNILLILLIIYLTIRNIVKLIFEDKARLFGAKLRTKLVMAFIFLSLIPTGLLFVISMQFVNTSLKLWFDERIEQSLEDAILIGRTYYDERESWLKDIAMELASSLSFRCLTQAPRLDKECVRSWLEEPLRPWLTKKLEGLRDVHAIEVRSANGTILFSKRSLEMVDQLPELPREYMDRIISSKDMDVFSQDLETGELLEAVVPLWYGTAGNSTASGILIVGFLMPQKVSNLLTAIKKGYEDYQTFKLYKDPLRATILITLFLITLLIIFVAVWFGFRLARHITEPVQALAEATYRIAQGDLDFTLEAKGKDELNALVRAFNTMTQDLKEAKRRAEKASQELKKSYMELERRQRYIEIILQNVAAGVISIDRAGVVRTMNRSAEIILGLNAKEIVGRPYSELLTPIQAREFDEIRRSLFSSPKGLVQRPMRIKLDDRELSLIVTFTVLRDQEGRSHGLVVVFDDLTELEKIQRMAAWREVARRIAHEVKNPLTPIQLNAQRLQRKYASRFNSEERAVFERCINTIVSQVEELKRLVNEFSSFARMPRLLPRPTDLRHIAEEVAFMYREGQPQCEIEVKAPGDLPTLSADPDQLKRMLINLVDNAVNAMPEGGTITIEISYSPEDEWITLEVRDTGPGISLEDRTRLFEPYFSRRKGGTGLGLAIVNSIVMDHGGQITIEENQPRGTRFIIKLPRKAPKHEKDSTGS